MKDVRRVGHVAAHTAGRAWSRRRALGAGAAAVLMPGAALGQAGDYPNKAVRFIVPFPPGGVTDGLSRILCQKLSEAFGQQFVVDNKAGAGGNVGVETLAKSPPDGYTVGLIGIASNVIAPALYASLPFDPVKDFTFVAAIAGWPNMLIIHPDIPAKSVPELIALLKKNPGKYNFGSAGAGTSLHLSGELFKQLAGVEIVHVPYKGSAPATQDLLAGQVHMMFDSMPTAWVQAQAGKVRPLAVTGPKRNPAAPDIPAMAEFLPGYAVEPWMGFAGPAGVHAAAVERLAKETHKALAQPDVVAAFKRLGADPWVMGPREVTDYVVKEKARWAPIVLESGARVN